MPGERQISAGRIRYQINFVANPNYRGGHLDLFSDALRAEIRRRNVPEWRIVYFDGSRARIEEINSDYEVRNLAVELRVAGSPTITYCKEFRYFGFCVDHKVVPPPGGPRPHLAPTGETATIAGRRCRKAEYHGNGHFFIWYTDEVAVNDPTGAVFSLEEVPGLILQSEEIPASDTTDVSRQVTVVELVAEPPSPEIFAVPANYHRFSNLDAARAEDRRMIDEVAAKELQSRPLDANERDMFVGEWLLERSNDKILVEIARMGDNQFRFRTTILTAPVNAAGRVSDEKASMKGRILMVEDLPNYRLYRLSDGGRTLSQVGNELFTFRRR